MQRLFRAVVKLHSTPLADCTAHTYTEEQLAALRAAADRYDPTHSVHVHVLCEVRIVTHKAWNLDRAEAPKGA